MQLLDDTHHRHPIAILTSFTHSTQLEIALHFDSGGAGDGAGAGPCP